jgi:hypothetical protein
MPVQTPITAEFWTGITILAVMRVSYHCRFLQTGSVLQLHCRSFTLPGRVQFNKHCQFETRSGSDRLTIATGLWLKLTVMAWSSPPVCGSSWQCWLPSLPVCGSNWQWYLDHHCRFIAQAGSVGLAITTGLWLKPTVPSWPSRPVWC